MIVLSFQWVHVCILVRAVKLFCAAEERGRGGGRGREKEGGERGRAELYGKPLLCPLLLFIALSCIIQHYVHTHTYQYYLCTSQNYKPKGGRDIEQVNEATSLYMIWCVYLLLSILLSTTSGQDFLPYRL